MQDEPFTNVAEHELSTDSNGFSVSALEHKYFRVRKQTEQLCSSLQTEDYVIQTMEDVSPTKWHLAHTSWFFETFILQEVFNDYSSPDERYAYLFNSYYVQVGERFSRPDRGLLSRPTVAEVYEYRAHVDKAMKRFFDSVDESLIHKLSLVIETGINHEQQHQELLLTDIKHVLSVNPIVPVFKEIEKKPAPPARDLQWISFPEGLYHIGHAGNGFAYDNEGPMHREFLEEFHLGHRLVTNGEYMEFMNDGGYEKIELWLSDGSAVMEERGWKAPLYWTNIEDQWHSFTLNGLLPIDPNEPVTHVSHYEADAFARWYGARLAGEAEWEVASARVPIAGNFQDTGIYHPVAFESDTGALTQMFGDVWEWTQSPYTPYPGYAPPPGAIGEYNGKFMANQMVLRGGSCATPEDHIRRTYRNFFHSPARWQFTGIRLAKNKK